MLCPSTSSNFSICLSLRDDADHFDQRKKEWPEDERVHNVAKNKEFLPEPDVSSAFFQIFTKVRGYVIVGTGGIYDLRSFFDDVFQFQLFPALFTMLRMIQKIIQISVR